MTGIHAFNIILDKAFNEIKRVLKPSGIFFICCESDNSGDTTWTSRIEGMTIHRAEDLKSRLLSTGFYSVNMHRNDKDWICLIATR